MSDNELPNFSNPPLVEVVVEFQFERLTAWRQAHIGAFWTRIRDDYPELQDQPLVDARVVAWEFSESVRPSRAWFLNARKDRLIQLQDDRLVTNWRRVSGGDPYPRYNEMLKAFHFAWDEFQCLLASLELELPRVEQIELTYINQVQNSDESVIKGEAPLKLPLEASLLESRRAYKYILRPEMGAGPATLSVIVDSVEAGTNLVLSCQEPVASLDAAWKGLDRARVAIVRTFDEITSPAMHRRWKEQ